MFPGEFCEIFKNTYFYRTPPGAASMYTENHIYIVIYLYINLFDFVKWSAFAYHSYIMSSQLLLGTLMVELLKYYIFSCISFQRDQGLIE